MFRTFVIDDENGQGGMATMTQKPEELKELKRLVGPDAARLKQANPDLADLLREYRKDWKAFREAMGSGSGKASTAPSRGRRYRA